MSDATHASWFSGVGGLDLGLERAGWRTVSFSEIDPYASAVLAERWSGVPNPGDITQLRTLRCLEAADAVLWTGGFPCQDLSVAGKRAGFAGERSSLAFAFLDLVERHRPPAILLENVPGLLSSHRGRDMAALLGRMVELGYGVAYRVLDARHFGVPQRRRRVFILGLRSDPDDPTGRVAAERAAQVLAVGTRCPRHPAAGGEAGADASGSTGHGVAADGATSTRTVSAAFGHHGYTVGSQDADGGLLQLSPTVTSKWSKGSGGPAGSEEGNRTVVPAVTAAAGRLGFDDEDQRVVVSPPPDPGQDARDRRVKDDPLIPQWEDRRGRPLYVAMRQDVGPAHRWDGQTEPSADHLRLVKVARCGFLLDFGITAYQWAGREYVTVPICERCEPDALAATEPAPVSSAGQGDLRSALDAAIDDKRRGIYSDNQRAAFHAAVEWFASKGLLAIQPSSDNEEDGDAST